MSKFTMLLTFLLIHNPSFREFFWFKSPFLPGNSSFWFLLSFTNLGQVAAFTSLRSYLNDLIPFERIAEQAIQTMSLSPKSITAATLWRQIAASLWKLQHFQRNLAFETPSPFKLLITLLGVSMDILWKNRLTIN